MKKKIVKHNQSNLKTELYLGIQDAACDGDRNLR
jgi:hypothetical protein